LPVELVPDQPFLVEGRLVFRVGPLGQVSCLVVERLAGGFHLDLRPLQFGIVRPEPLLHLEVFALEPDVILSQPLDQRIVDGFGHVVGTDVLQPGPDRFFPRALDLGFRQGRVEPAQAVDDRRLVVAQGDDIGLGLKPLELAFLLLDLGLEAFDLFGEEGRRLLGRRVLHVDVEVDEGRGQGVDAVGRQPGVPRRKRDVDQPRQPHGADGQAFQEIVDEPFAKDMIVGTGGFLRPGGLADEFRVCVELELFDHGVGQAAAAEEPVLGLVEIVPHGFDLEDLVE